MSTTHSTTPPAPPVPSSAAGEGMKAAFRHHPSGVAIITATTDRGPSGLTASSVASVAIDPAAIMFSVTRATGSAGAILEADSFIVHLIDAEHAQLAQNFAVSGSERFTEAQGWTTLETGEPYLPGARVALRCQTLHTVTVGSSVVVIAEVLEVIEGTRGEPIVYIDRAFHGVSAN